MRVRSRGPDRRHGVGTLPTLRSLSDTGAVEYNWRMPFRQP